MVHLSCGFLFQKNSFLRLLDVRRLAEPLRRHRYNRRKGYVSQDPAFRSLSSMRQRLVKTGGWLIPAS
jgi:hypothetical protein